MMNIGTGSVLTVVAIAIFVAVLIFFVFRAIVLWYWRVNETVALLRSIDAKLGRMLPREHQVDDIRLGDIDSLAPSRD
jgi:hypothetical protein